MPRARREYVLMHNDILLGKEFGSIKPMTKIEVEKVYEHNRGSKIRVFKIVDITDYVKNCLRLKDGLKHG
jgi:hypothetical protein